MFWLKGKNVKFNIRGAILITMLGVTAVMMIFGLAPLPTSFLSFPSGIFDIAFKLDIFGALRLDYLPFIMVFFMGDVFSTTGTAMACVEKSGLNKDGKFNRWNQIFFVDAFSAPIGATFGITTPTCYVESAAGITDGGRTGMTSLTTGALFLVSLLLSPIFISIPSVASGVALVLVGIEMFTSLGNIDFKNPVVFAPLAVMVALTVFIGDFASAMCVGLIIWIAFAVFSRFVLREKEHLPDRASIIMAAAILLMSVTKLVFTIS